MAGFGLPLTLLSLLASFPLCRAFDDAPLKCVGQAAVSEECLEPLANITELVPNASYFARIPCMDCGVKRSSDSERISHQDNDLLFNITLTPDNRTLLLNSQPIFPGLPTIPHPPNLRAAHIDPDFARTHLDDMRACTRTKCPGPDPQCPLDRCLNAGSFLSSATIDYQTWSEHLDPLPASSSPDADTRPTERWHVVLDPLRGLDVNARVLWNTTVPHALLRIELAGVEVPGARYPAEKDIQSGSSLFGSIAASQAVYNFTLLRVDVISSSSSSSPYTSPIDQPRQTGFFAALRRFFGAERANGLGSVVYLREEWGRWGRYGSLRQYVGVVLHEWRWDVVARVVGGVLGGAAACWGAWWMFWVVKEQRELARWDGMDVVWENIRRGGGGGGGEGSGRAAGAYMDEEDGLLRGAGVYRDEPEDGDVEGESGFLARYTDEVRMDKPLPSKPLPEKPLPAVPLIDA